MTSWEVIYNGYSIGGSGDAQPIGEFSYSEEFFQAVTEQSFILIGVGSTNAQAIADYRDKELAMVAALTVPEQALLIQNGATVFKELDPAKGQSGTVESNVERTEDPRNTPSQQVWLLTVLCDLPATEKQFRRQGQIVTTFSTNRRKLVGFSGTYSFSDDGGTRVSAYDTFRANFIAWAAANLVRLGGSFELLSEGPADEDHDGDLCGFLATYREINYTAGTSGVIAESLAVSRIRSIRESPQRVFWDATYSATFDFTITPESQIVPVWRATLRDIILSKIENTIGRDAVVVLSEDVEPIITENMLTVTLSGIGVASGFTFLTKASLTLTYLGTRQQLFVLRGQYIAEDGVALASQKYADNIDALESALLPIPVNETELVEEQAPLFADDEGTTFDWVRTRRQLIYTVGAGGVNAEVFGFSLDGQYTHGKSGQVAPMTGTISYFTKADKDVTDQDALYGLYQLARKNLLGKVNTLFGKSAIVRGESIKVDPNGTIRGSMSLFFPGFGSTLLSHDEVVSYRVTYNNTRRRRLDGKHSTYNRFSPGADVRAVARLRTRTLNGALAPSPISTAPQAPPGVWGVPTAGAWVVDDDTVAVSRVEWGANNVDPSSGTSLIVTQEGSRTYTWEARGSKKVKAVTIGDVKVPEVSAITTAVST